MAKVIDIEDSRPHLVVHCLNSVHVIPVSVIEAKADGSMPLIMLGQEYDDKEILRAILAEWLILIGERRE